MKTVAVMLIAAAFALTGCVPHPGENVKQANARRDSANCVAQHWLHNGIPNQAQLSYLSSKGLHAYRKRYGTNPPSGPPEINAIERQCQNPVHPESTKLVIPLP